MVNSGDLLAESPTTVFPWWVFRFSTLIRQAIPALESGLTNDKVRVLRSHIRYGEGDASIPQQKAFCKWRVCT
jgi:hypothetical protein